MHKIDIPNVRIPLLQKNHNDIIRLRSRRETVEKVIALVTYFVQYPLFVLDAVDCGYWDVF